MKHHGKLIAAATGVALVSLVMVFRGRNRGLGGGSSDPLRPPTYEVRNSEGKLLETRVINESEVPMEVLWELQNGLPVRYPGQEGTLTVINAEKWAKLYPPGVKFSYAWGPPKLGGDQPVPPPI